MTSTDRPGEAKMRTFTVDEVRNLMDAAADLREERMELTGRAWRERPMWDAEMERLLTECEASRG